VTQYGYKKKIDSHSGNLLVLTKQTFFLKIKVM
jgi:hypothetical protein